MSFFKKVSCLLFFAGFVFFCNFTFATYCSYNHYGNYHCTYDDGSYAYFNNQTNGNPYSGLPYYYSNGGGSYSYYVYEQTYVKELTPKEKCQKKYPGTTYRKSDGWCACPGDREGMSTWDKKLNRCLTKDELDKRCDQQYSGTIYRRTDGRCACPGDREKGFSSWSESYGCLFSTSYFVRKTSVKKEIDTDEIFENTVKAVYLNEKSSWGFFWKIFKIEFLIVLLLFLLGGKGILIVWFLLGLPILLYAALVGFGIIEKVNRIVILLFTFVWFGFGVLLLHKFFKGFFSFKK